MKDERINQIQAEKTQLRNVLRQLRQREDDVRARQAALAQPSQMRYNSVKDLKNNLDANLNYFMRPCNVGGINEVAWPFFFNCSVDFGTDPAISSTNSRTTRFQVDQEACFLLMSITRQSFTDANQISATDRAPLEVQFVDLQSTRQFQNTPVPLQAIGDNSLPLILPTPQLILPSALIEVTVRGIPATAQTLGGNGQIDFSFFGYRTRIENAERVLSTIFAAGW